MNRYTRWMTPLWLIRISRAWLRVRWLKLELWILKRQAAREKFTCPACGYEMETDDKYGCPNCHGEGLK